MKHLLLPFCLFLCNICNAQQNTELVSNEFIVKFKQGQDQFSNIDATRQSSRIRELNDWCGVSEIREIKRKTPSRSYVLKFEVSEIPLENILEAYSDTGIFEYVEPNFIAHGSGVEKISPNDSHYFNQWAMFNDGTFSQSNAVSGADISMEMAWDIEEGDPDLIVAIIDSGVRMSHPEFEDRVWTNDEEIEDGIDNDNNGYVDDLVGGWDFINNDNEPIDDHGHGTNVAGIALATGNNNEGYAGVNWHSKMMVCKALNEENSGSYAAMAGGIYYAVDNGAKVINMSIGGSSLSSTLRDAVDYCYENGVILVACMMNFNNDVAYYPAAFANCIAVGATNPDDTRTAPFFWSNTSGSNYGSHIDLVAPGNYMYGLSYNNDWWYGSYWGGTSQASPLVAGVVSLLLSQNPSLTFDEIRLILADSADDQVGDASEDVAGFDIYHGHGRLNAYRALSHQIVNTIDIERLSAQVELYPNPISQGETLLFSGLMTGQYEVSVYDAQGQKVRYFDKLISKDRSLRLQLGWLDKGSYFVQVSHKSEQLSLSRKVIII